MIKVLDQLIVVVLELLKAIIIIEEFVNRAILAVEQIFN